MKTFLLSPCDIVYCSLFDFNNVSHVFDFYVYFFSLFSNIETGSHSMVVFMKMSEIFKWIILNSSTLTNISKCLKSYNGGGYIIWVNFVFSSCLFIIPMTDNYKAEIYAFDCFVIDNIKIILYPVQTAKTIWRQFRRLFHKQWKNQNR